MKGAAIAVVLALVVLLVPTALVAVWVGGAAKRVQAQASAPAAESEVAVAHAAEEQYCTPELKRILRRVLQSCGLLAEGPVRGCQPVQARSVATVSGGDFNALFLPMAKRAGIVQFDRDAATLDDADKGLVDRVFSDQRGASYFFVVSRASPEGSVEHNRELSKGRAAAVLDHLRQTFQDPDLDKEVGLLWLGEEFAQLDAEFCTWQRSGTGDCRTEDLNRSAFFAWIDCRL